MTGCQWSLGPGALRHFQMDGGTSLVSRRIERLLARLGFGATVTSAPDTPQNNAVAESAVRYFRERLPATMTAGQIPSEDWYYAAISITAAHNKLATQSVVRADGKEIWVSPDELFTGQRPTLKHNIVCGTPCCVLRLGVHGREEDGPFAVRCRPGRAYYWGGDGLQVDGTWRRVLGWVCRLDDGRLVFSREVKFDERSIIAGGHAPKFSGQADADGADETADADSDAVESQGDESDEHACSDADAAGDLPHASATEGPGTVTLTTGGEGTAGGTAPPGIASDLLLDSEPDPGLPGSGHGGGAVDQQGTLPTLSARTLRTAGARLAPGRDPAREDRTSRRAPQLFAALAAVLAAVTAATPAMENPSEDESDDEADLPVATPGQAALPDVRASDVRIPRNYVEAFRSQHREYWMAAVEEHLAGHQVRGTFVEVIVPDGTRTLPTSWVFAIKADERGLVTRFKARSVLGGHKQVAGVDFQEVFAPTLRAEQVRLMLALGAKMQGRPLRGLRQAQVRVIRPADVVNAYLQSELGEDEQPLHALPQGYTPKLAAPPGFRVVGRSIYAHPGLKQAGRAWHRTQRTQLLARGFVEYPGAPCIYYKDLGDGQLIAVGTFVDDLLWLNVSDSPDAIEKIVADLKGHYEVKLASSLEKFLGANFRETEDGIFMHLRQYVTELLERHGMHDCTAVVTPEVVTRLQGARDETLLRGSDVKLYQQVTGGLMFASSTARLDIAHAVGMLARRMSTPRVCDMVAAKRVLRYLQGTAGLGIFFPYAEHAITPGLVAYADSDWASDPEQRKSTSGYLVFYNGAPVSWRSGLQDTIALSSCEAEYTALSECSREVTYLRGIVGFLGQNVNQPTVIYEDNQGTIDLVGNPVHHRRTKHVDVRWHYIRHVQESGAVKVVKIHTDDNHADILTKATDVPTFVRHVTRIMRAAPPAH